MNTKFWMLLALFVGLSLAACAGTPPPTHVPPGKVYLLANPNYEFGSDAQNKWLPERLTEGEKIDNAKSWVVKDYAVVANDPKEGSPMVGVYGETYLPTGSYVRIPKEDVMFVKASVVANGFVGVYCQPDTMKGKKQNLLLSPGYNAYPKDRVTEWPVGELAFRTLSTVPTDKPSLLEQYKANPSDPRGPCGGRFHCDASIANALLNGVLVGTTIDTDILFGFDLRNPDKLCELRTPLEAVQTYIASFVRSNGRTISEKWTEDEFASSIVQVAWEEAMKAMLLKEIGDRPIPITRVLRRSYTVGDAAYQKQKSEQQSERLKKREELKAAEDNTKILEETLRQSDLKKKNDRDQAEENAQSLSKIFALLKLEKFDPQVAVKALELVFGQPKEQSPPAK